jgi:hypothetical protein
MAFDSSRGVETIVMSFIVNRPDYEPGFRLTRQETHGRTIRYTVHSDTVHSDTVHSDTAGRPHPGRGAG